MKLILPIHIEKKYNCIHLHSQGEERQFNVLIVGVKGSELRIIDQFKANSAEDLAAKIDKKLPAVLAITGAKIIDKKLTKSPNYLSEVLFNNPLQDFYLNEFDLDDQMLVSISRKEHIDSILKELQDLGVQLVDFRIGGWILKAIAALLPAEELIASTGLQYITATHELINAKETETKNYVIADQLLASNYTAAFATIVNMLLPQGSSSNYDEQITQAKEDYKFKTLFKKVGVVMLGFLLISLVASYLLTGHYNEKQLELQAELSSHLQVKSKVESLRNDRDYKQQILGASQLGREQLLSNYLWQLGESVPKQIQLSELTLFPLEGKIKKNEEINLTNGLIRAKGTAATTKDFSAWIEQLRAKDWIGKVEVLEFQRKQRENQFEITIGL